VSANKKLSDVIKQRRIIALKLLPRGIGRGRRQPPLTKELVAEVARVREQLAEAERLVIIPPGPAANNGC
jgi:hypothetical protein